MSSRGVTFLELLIVVALVAALSVVAMPRMRGAVENFQLQSFVRDVYYLTRYLQGSSIGQGKVFRLTLDQGQGALEAAVKDGTEFKTLPGKFGKIYKIPAGCTMAVTPAEAEYIFFYPDGNVTPSLKILFSSQYNKEITLSLKGAVGEITEE